MSENFNNVLSKITNAFNNDYISLFAVLFVICYASAIAPKLPPKVLEFFDSNLAKVIFFLFVAFTYKKNAMVALMVSLAFIFTIFISHKITIERLTIVNKEGLISTINTSSPLDDFIISFKTEEGKKVGEEIIKNKNSGKINEKEAVVALETAVIREKNDKIDQPITNESKIKLKNEITNNNLENIDEVKTKLITTEVINDAKKIISKTDDANVLAKIVDAKENNKPILKIADNVIEIKKDIEEKNNMKMNFEDVKGLCRQVLINGCSSCSNIPFNEDLIDSKGKNIQKIEFSDSGSSLFSRI